MSNSTSDPILCAEDDSVTLQRRSRFLKQHHLDAMTLPAPRKFAQFSNSSNGLIRSRSSLQLCARADGVPRGELCNDANCSSLRRSSSWSCTSLRASLMEEDFHMRRPPSLEVQWESIVTGSASETAEAADSECPALSVSHPLGDALADPSCSPRALPLVPPPCIASS